MRLASGPYLKLVIANSCNFESKSANDINGCIELDEIKTKRFVLIQKAFVFNIVMYVYRFYVSKYCCFKTSESSKALTQPPQPPIDTLRSLGRLPSAPDDRVITLGVSRLVEAQLEDVVMTSSLKLYKPLAFRIL